MSDQDGDDDPWPDEPDEFDPESLGPEVRVPEVPEPPSPDLSEAEVPPELARAFWTTVMLVNAGLLGVSVGAMVVVFWGDLRRGGGLAVVGLAAFGLAYRRYVRYRDGRDDRPRTTADGGQVGRNGERSPGAEGRDGTPEGRSGDDTANRPEG